MKKLGLLLIGLCFAFSSFSQSIEYEIENVEATKIVKIEWENLHFDKLDSVWVVTVYIKESSYYIIEGDTIQGEVKLSTIKGGIGAFAPAAITSIKNTVDVAIKNKYGINE